MCVHTDIHQNQVQEWSIWWWLELNWKIDTYHQSILQALYSHLTWSTSIWGPFQYKRIRLNNIGIPMLKIRLSWLSYLKHGNPYTLERSLYIEMGPSCLWVLAAAHYGINVNPVSCPNNQNSLHNHTLSAYLNRPMGNYFCDLKTNSEYGLLTLFTMQISNKSLCSSDDT